MVACALSLRISKRQWSGRARQSSPTLQPLRELRTSIEHQFAQSQVFATPMPQPTPSIRDLTTPSEHQIATIEEVIPPLGEPAERLKQDATPIKQVPMSSSPLNSNLISSKNFKNQGGHQILRQNHPTLEVGTLSSGPNSQSLKVANPITHHPPNAEDPALIPPPLSPRTYQQSKSLTRSSDALAKQETCALVRRYRNPIIFRPFHQHSKSNADNFTDHHSQSKNLNTTSPPLPIHSDFVHPHHQSK